MFWKGRAWLYAKREIKAEWYFGKHARGFSLTINFGGDDDNRGIMFHACIPFLFSIYLGAAGFLQFKQPHKTGVAIHNCAIWFYPFSNEHGQRRDDAWYYRMFHFDFPWQWDWHSTEVLKPVFGMPYETFYIEKRGDRKRRNIDSFVVMREKEAAALMVSEEYDYTYTLKNGDKQYVRATIFAERMTWRMRWWPVLRFKKVSTSISVRFSAPVGEGIHSWKGGTTGCGYTLKPFESPRDCLKRMESERKFDR